MRWRWIDYRGMPEAEEREHIRRTVATIRDLCGAPPLGWYTGRYSDNTRRLVMEETETLYDSDAYNDDLPYWVRVAGKPRLIVPYALDTNDFKFALSPGWMSGEDFFTYLRAAFDQLYREGAQEPKMMSIGLHGRLVGRPGRTDALARFMDHVQRHDDGLDLPAGGDRAALDGEAPASRMTRPRKLAPQAPAANSGRRRDADLCWPLAPRREEKNHARTRAFTSG